MKNLLTIKDNLYDMKSRGYRSFQMPTTGGPNINIDDLIKEIEDLEFIYRNQ